MAANVCTSFQKKARSKTNTLPGTKPSIQNSQLLISSGVPSVDTVIGGGIPVGSLLIIEEDRFGTFAKLLLKYFLSEGVVSTHALFIGTQDVDSKQLVSELPGPIGYDASDDTSAAAGHDEMTIAWRYQNLKTVKSSVMGSQHFGHYFDLSTNMNDELIKNSDISHWIQNPDDTNETFETSNYGCLLRSIHMKLKSGKFFITDSQDQRNVLRIGLFRLGTPLWPNQYLLKFLYCLRALLRNSFATCIVTVPTQLYKDQSFSSKCLHLSDICLRLESFTGTALEKNPALSDYHGFFRVLKIAAINSLFAYVPKTLDLAFKLRRKKLIIEKLHLPPELEDSTEREQDDVGSVSCSSAKTSKLEF